MYFTVISGSGSKIRAQTYTLQKNPFNEKKIANNQKLFNGDEPFLVHKTTKIIYFSCSVVISYLRCCSLFSRNDKFRKKNLATFRMGKKIKMAVRTDLLFCFMAGKFIVHS